MVVRQGYRVVFAEGAIAYEETAGRVRQELRMRVRVAARGMLGLSWALRRLRPRRHAVAWAQLFAHKIARWLVPVFGVTALVSGGALVGTSKVYTVLFALQVAFYLLALGGLLAERAGLRGQGLWYFPLWLCISNVATLAGMVRVASRRQVVVWSPVRDPVTYTRAGCESATSSASSSGAGG
jgi:hypothetical protein